MCQGIRPEHWPSGLRQILASRLAAHAASIMAANVVMCIASTSAPLSTSVEKPCCSFPLPDCDHSANTTATRSK